MSNEEKSNINIKEVKVVLIGDSGVGKTSIIQQFSKNEFNPYSNPSISSQFSTKEFKIPDSKITIKYDLWDTAGQEIYRSLAKIFFKDAKIIILVYEIGNKNSFESLQNYWYQEVISNSSSNPILAVVGNKNDLYQKQQVDPLDAKDFAKKLGGIFQLTSAMTSEGIGLLFDNIGKKILKPSYQYDEKDKIAKDNYNKKKEEEKNTKIRIKLNNNSNISNTTNNNNDDGKKGGGGKKKNNKKRGWC